MTEKSDAANLIADQTMRAYLDLVYASALRRLRDDADRAADVTQAVMLVLLRKSREGKLPPEKYMAGWLIKVTGYAVMQLNRAAARRTRHESQAARIMPRQSTENKLSADIREALDESLLKLNDADREAIIRRCLQGQSLTEIGHVLKMSENTVGKRIARAIPKLRSLLSHRGITAPTAAIATVLTAEQLIKAPAIAMTPAVAPAITALVKNLSWKIAMVKAKAIALVSLAILLFVGGGTAIFLAFGLPSTAPAIPISPASAPTMLPWPSTQPTITVSRVIDGPNELILNDVLAGLRANQNKLHVIHVQAADGVRMYDANTKTWSDTTGAQGQAWLQAGPDRRFRAEVEKEQTRSMRNNGQLGPVKDSSFIETWDGTTTRREYHPPFSVPLGETFNTRYLKAQNLAGADFSMQLAWDEETAADSKGTRTTIYRNPLDPAVLATMKLSARRVTLSTGQTAVELTVNIPDPQVQRIEAFWFDPQRGYGLLARRNTLSLQNQVLMKRTFIIQELTEAAPGIFYPSKAQSLWENRGIPLLWETYSASQVTANEPINANTFSLQFTPGIEIDDFKDGVGTKRKPTTAPH